MTAGPGERRGPPRPAGCAHRRHAPAAELAPAAPNLRAPAGMAEQRPAHRGLSGPGLADAAEDLATGDLEIDVADDRRSCCCDIDAQIRHRDGGLGRLGRWV